MTSYCEFCYDRPTRVWFVVSDPDPRWVAGCLTCASRNSHPSSLGRVEFPTIEEYPDGPPW